jgi:hypothetical protein
MVVCVRRCSENVYIPILKCVAEMERGSGWKLRIVRRKQGPSRSLGFSTWTWIAMIDFSLMSDFNCIE